MKVLILAVGRPREKALASLAGDYLARIRPAGLVGVERTPDVPARSPEEAMTELMMAKFMQEASLSVISQIIQPTLLNFLR